MHNTLTKYINYRSSVSLNMPLNSINILLHDLVNVKVVPFKDRAFCLISWICYQCCQEQLRFAWEHQANSPGHFERAMIGKGTLP